MDAQNVLLLFLWSIVEMAFLPVPDLLVIPLVASEHLPPLVVAIVGTIGSMIGGLVDYYLGRTSFLLLESRFAITKKVESLKLRFKYVANYGFLALLILGRLVPFMVLKPVMVLAGCVRYNWRIFIIVIALASFVRYYADATLGSLLSLLMRF